MTSKWDDIRAKLGAPPRDAAATEQRIGKELRRLAVEALIDAHYDTYVDAAAELAWFEARPEEARALIGALEWSQGKR